MGCRPSRRAVACVRVGEGPWGVGRSSRPRSAGESGVRLRQRTSSRRTNDEGGGTQGGGGNPRDRYSAPPTDRQFPPHSCISATYEHGCCGTSRITLRLSKNGSTLEIEKCDFNHTLRSCQQCGPRTPSQAESPHSSHLVRTQSAPNLSFSPSETICSPPPRPPRHTRVEAESDPPPLPPRHNGRVGQVIRMGRGDSSPPVSVCTATRVSVDMESSCHTHSPLPSADIGFQDTVKIHPEEGSRLSNEASASDSVYNHVQNLNDHYGLHNSTVLVRSSTFPNGEAQKVTVLSLCPHDLTVEESSDSDSVQSLANHHNHMATQTVDLTSFYSPTIHMQRDNVGVDSHRVDLPQMMQTEAEGATCGKIRQTKKGDRQNSRFLSGNDPTTSGNDPTTSGNDPTTSEAAGSSFGSDKSAVNCSSSDCWRRNGPLACGATDYRVRMLTGGDGAMASTRLNHTTVQMKPGFTGNRVTLGSKEIPVLAVVSSSPVMLCANGGQRAISGGDCLLTLGANSSPKTLTAVRDEAASDERDIHSAVPCAGDSSSWDCPSNESTDTGCESDDEGERKQEFARLEMAPAYVHADFKNDFEDLFDDSSPGFDTS